MSNTRKLPKTKEDDAGPGSDEDFEFVTSVLEEVEDAEGNVTEVPVVIVVPSMAMIKPNTTRMTRLQREDPTGIKGTDYLFDLALGEQREFVESLPGGEEQEFLKAWRKHSGVGLGESRAS